MVLTRPHSKSRFQVGKVRAKHPNRSIDILHLLLECDSVIGVLAQQEIGSLREYHKGIIQIYGAIHRQALVGTNIEMPDLQKQYNWHSLNGVGQRFARNAAKPQGLAKLKVALPPPAALDSALGRPSALECIAFQQDSTITSFTPPHAFASDSGDTPHHLMSNAES